MSKILTYLFNFLLSILAGIVANYTFMWLIK